MGTEPTVHGSVSRASARALVNGPPRLESLPEAVWINPPEKTTHQIAPGSTQRREDDPEVVPILTAHAPIARPGALVTPQECGLVTQ